MQSYIELLAKQFKQVIIQSNIGSFAMLVILNCAVLC